MKWKFFNMWLRDPITIIIGFLIEVYLFYNPQNNNNYQNCDCTSEFFNGAIYGIDRTLKKIDSLCGKLNYIKNDNKGS